MSEEWGDTMFNETESFWSHRKQRLEGRLNSEFVRSKTQRLVVAGTSWWLEVQRNDGKKPKREHL